MDLMLLTVDDRSRRTDLTRTDLIVLPEMFTTGFTMDAATYAETMDGQSIAWMKEMAADKNASVCGSLIIAENNKYYNRFICVDPSGQEVFYDKRHLFRLANEQQHFAAGNETIIFEINDWRICPMVCYDLRFPVWLRNVDDYTSVAELVPAGPADKSGLIHPSDRIVSVGQGDSGPLIDVVGWRLDDVVELIRGPKDSLVRLR